MVDGCKVEPCGSAEDGSFEVFGEASVAAQPGECALDDPAAGEQLKALGLVGSLDDSQRPLADFCQCLAQFVAGPSTLLRINCAAIGEDMTQPWEVVSDAGENIHSTVAVPETSSGQALDIGGVDDGADQKTLRVGDDMTLPALDLFTRIIPPRPAAFRGFDALAVDYTC